MTNIVTPTVGASQGTWGTTLNGDLVLLAADLTAAQAAIGGLNAQSLNTTLIGWTNAQAWAWTTPVYDSDLYITSAAITWPDGTTGTYTGVTKNATFLGMCDAFTVTYINGFTSKTVTQGLITRTAAGKPASQPSPVVT